MRTTPSVDAFSGREEKGRKEGRKEGRVAATAAPKGSLIYLHEAALSLTHSALVFGRTPRSSRAATRRGV